MLSRILSVATTPSNELLLPLVTADSNPQILTTAGTQNSPLNERLHRKGSRRRQTNPPKPATYAQARTLAAEYPEHAVSLLSSPLGREDKAVVPKKVSSSATKSSNRQPARAAQGLRTSIIGSESPYAAKTYAAATNLAAQYPEHAAAILSTPLASHGRDNEPNTPVALKPCPRGLRSRNAELPIKKPTNSSPKIASDVGQRRAKRTNKVNNTENQPPPSVGTPGRNREARVRRRSAKLRASLPWDAHDPKSTSPINGISAAVPQLLHDPADDQGTLPEPVRNVPVPAARNQTGDGNDGSLISSLTALADKAVGDEINESEDPQTTHEDCVASEVVHPSQVKLSPTSSPEVDQPAAPIAVTNIALPSQPTIPAPLADIDDASTGVCSLQSQSEIQDGPGVHSLSDAVCYPSNEMSILHAPTPFSTPIFATDCDNIRSPAPTGKVSSDGLDSDMNATAASLSAIEDMLPAVAHTSTNVVLPLIAKPITSPMAVATPPPALGIRAESPISAVPSPLVGPSRVRYPVRPVQTPRGLALAALQVPPRERQSAYELASQFAVAQVQRAPLSPLRAEAALPAFHPSPVLPMPHASVGMPTSRVVGLGSRAPRFDRNGMQASPLRIRQRPRLESVVYETSSMQNSVKADSNDGGELVGYVEVGSWWMAKGTML